MNEYAAGSTSIVDLIFIQDSASTTGGGKTGLVFNTAGLTCYYKRSNGTASVQVVLATITTFGTFSSGGLREIDSVNMPGCYEFHPPDAAFASGAKEVTFFFAGASGMVQRPIKYRILAINPDNAVNAGIGALPAVASGSTGAIPTTGTGANQILTLNGWLFAMRVDPPYQQLVNARTGTVYGSSAVHTATNATSAGDQILMGLGDFTQTAKATPAAYVTLRGAGPNLTRITTSVGIGGAVSYRLASGDAMEGLTYIGSDNTVLQYLVGGTENDASYTHASFRNVQFVGGTDVFWSDTGVTATHYLYNCRSVTQWDQTAGSSANFIAVDTDWISTGGSVVSSSASHGPNLPLEQRGGSIDVRDGGAGGTIAVQVQSNTKLRNVAIYANNSLAGPAGIDVSVADGGKATLVGCSFAMDRLTTAGTGSITIAGSLMPTVGGRSLDVSTTGEAGIDLANIGSPTAVVNLTNTTIGTLTTYTGNTPQTGDGYAIVNSNTFGNAKLVRSTTPANTLDVAATGEAGIDLSNIKQATIATTLTNIRVPNVTLTDSLTTYTGNTPQTGDNYARLGAPAGASVSADIAAVKTAADLTNAKIGTPAGASVSADIAGVKTDIAAVKTAADLTNTRLGVPTGASFSADIALVEAGIISLGGVVDPNQGSSAYRKVALIFQDPAGARVGGATAVITADSAGTIPVVAGNTNSQGIVELMLRPGTYYVWWSNGRTPIDGNPETVIVPAP
jgi:hypothetical protein